jgi:hypothetical protein
VADSTIQGLHGELEAGKQLCDRIIGQARAELQAAVDQDAVINQTAKDQRARRGGHIDSEISSLRMQSFYASSGSNDSERRANEREKVSAVKFRGVV